MNIEQQATEILRQLAARIAVKYGGVADAPPLENFEIVTLARFPGAPRHKHKRKVGTGIAERATHPMPHRCQLLLHIPPRDQRAGAEGEVVLCGPAWELERKASAPGIAAAIVRLDAIRIRDCETGRKMHPLADAVREWHKWHNARIRPAEIDRKQKGIIPRAAGSRDHHLANIGAAPQPRQATLPGFAPDPAQPALIVTLMQESGAMLGGHGAPLACRIFTEALMAAPLSERTGGGIVEVSATVQEVFGDWLQRTTRNYKWRKPKYGGILVEALESTAKIGIPYGQHGGQVKPVTAPVWSGLRLQDEITFYITYPPGSGAGAGVDRKVLRVVGKKSGPAYLLYLSLCFDWDRYGTYRGSRILSTRPEVRRDAAGHILDLRGNLLPGRAGQGPSKRWSHPAAVRTGEREQNPDAIKHYPTYTENDLVRMIYGPRAGNANFLRTHRSRALKALRLIEQAGGCIVHKLPEELRRIMPPNA